MSYLLRDRTGRGKITLFFLILSGGGYIRLHVSRDMIVGCVQGPLFAHANTHTHTQRNVSNKQRNIYEEKYKKCLADSLYVIDWRDI